MNYEISTRLFLQLQNQSGIIRLQNKVLNQTKINFTRDNPNKTSIKTSNSNRTTAIKTRITKIIQELIHISRITITKADIQIRITIKVNSKISM